MGCRSTRCQRFRNQLKLLATSVFTAARIGNVLAPYLDDPHFVANAMVAGDANLFRTVPSCFAFGLPIRPAMRCTISMSGGRSLLQRVWFLRPRKVSALFSSIRLTRQWRSSTVLYCRNCLAGCNPLGSHQPAACAPVPACRATEASLRSISEGKRLGAELCMNLQYRFDSESGRILPNSSVWTGDAEQYDWLLRYRELAFA